MKIASEQLILDLISKTENVIKRTLVLQELTADELNKRDSPESWSVLECLEHLNKYGRFYLKEISNKMAESKTIHSPQFKSGVLGNYFANSMLPVSSTKKKLNKMKTFSNMNPINSKLTAEVIVEFLNQQQEMLRLLQIAKTKDLNKIKCGITISKLIKLRLGDTFRFVIYHNERHLVQAEKVVG